MMERLVRIEIVVIKRVEKEDEKGTYHSKRSLLVWVRNGIERLGEEDVLKCLHNFRFSATQLVQSFSKNAVKVFVCIHISHIVGPVHHTRMHPAVNRAKKPDVSSSVQIISIDLV